MPSFIAGGHRGANPFWKGNCARRAAETPRGLASPIAEPAAGLAMARWLCNGAMGGGRSPCRRPGGTPMEQTPVTMDRLTADGATLHAWSPTPTSQRRPARSLIVFRGRAQGQWRPATSGRHRVTRTCSVRGADGGAGHMLTARGTVWVVTLAAMADRPGSRASRCAFRADAGKGGRERPAAPGCVGRGCYQAWRRQREVKVKFTACPVGPRRTHLPDTASAGQRRH